MNYWELRNLRFSLGLKQCDVAAQLGVGPSVLVQFELYGLPLPGKGVKEKQYEEILAEAEEAK